MQIAKVQFGVAGAVAIVALGLAVFVPRVPAPHVHELAIAGATDAGGLGAARLSGATLHYALGDGSSHAVRLPGDGAPVEHEGVAAREWKAPVAGTDGATPRTLSLDQLVSADGGRLPVGISPSQDPGPFDATWDVAGTLTVWSADGVLLDAQQSSRVVVTLSGGGLTTPRTVSLGTSDLAAPSWAATDAATRSAATAIADAQAASAERRLWAVELPAALGIAALVTAAFGLRSRRRALAAAQNSPVDPTVPAAPQPEPQRSSSLAAQ
jgi:high-affinity iron transporter